MALSSINLGLQQTPDLTDIASSGKLGFQFISIYNALNILAGAIDTYTGNTPADAQGNYQNQTPEQSILLGNQTVFWGNSAGAIGSGFLVRIDDSGNVALADASISNPNPVSGNYSTGAAQGISLTSTSGGGQKIKVMLMGLVNFGAGNVKPGAPYWLSNPAGSIFYNTNNITTGQIIQLVGRGIDSSSIFIQPSLYWTTK